VGGGGGGGAGSRRVDARMSRRVLLGALPGDVFHFEAAPPHVVAHEVPHSSYSSRRRVYRLNAYDILLYLPSLFLSPLYRLQLCTRSSTFLLFNRLLRAKEIRMPNWTFAPRQVGPRRSEGRTGYGVSRCAFERFERLNASTSGHLVTPDRHRFSTRRSRSAVRVSRRRYALRRSRWSNAGRRRRCR